MKGTSSNAKSIASAESRPALAIPRLRLRCVPECEARPHLPKEKGPPPWTLGGDGRYFIRPNRWDSTAPSLSEV